MNCERIQDLILTDYLDDQMDKSQKKYLEEHLSSCPQCMEFARIAKKAAFEPFVNAEKLSPPGSVWSNIQGSILAEQQGRTNFLVNLLDRFGWGSPIPRPAFAFASVMIMVLLVGTLTEYKIHQRVSAKEQIEYLSSLTNPSETSSGNGGQGFDTAVEQYFL